MLCDKFIFGIRDADALKERILRETGELTLERAVSLAQRPGDVDVYSKSYL